jgi:hypothetical protein
MPLYYFHVHNGETTIDEEGQELPDAAAARVRALKEVRALICETVRNGSLFLSHYVEVQDAAGAPVLDLAFGDALDIKP